MTRSIDRAAIMLALAQFHELSSHEDDQTQLQALAQDSHVINLLLDAVLGREEGDGSEVKTRHADGDSALEKRILDALCALFALPLSAEDALPFPHHPSIDRLVLACLRAGNDDDDTHSRLNALVLLQSLSSAHEGNVAYVMLFRPQLVEHVLAGLILSGSTASTPAIESCCMRLLGQFCKSAPKVGAVLLFRYGESVLDALLPRLMTAGTIPLACLAALTRDPGNAMRLTIDRAGVVAALIACVDADSASSSALAVLENLARVSRLKRKLVRTKPGVFVGAVLRWFKSAKKEVRSSALRLTGLLSVDDENQADTFQEQRDELLAALLRVVNNSGGGEEAEDDCITAMWALYNLCCGDRAAPSSRPTELLPALIKCLRLEDVASPRVRRCALTVLHTLAGEDEEVASGLVVNYPQLVPGVLSWLASHDVLVQTEALVLVQNLAFVPGNKLKLAHLETVRPLIDVVAAPHHAIHPPQVRLGVLVVLHNLTWACAENQSALLPLLLPVLTAIVAENINTTDPALPVWALRVLQNLARPTANKLAIVSGAAAVVPELVKIVAAQRTTTKATAALQLAALPVLQSLAVLHDNQRALYGQCEAALLGKLLIFNAPRQLEQRFDKVQVAAAWTAVNLVQHAECARELISSPFFELLFPVLLLQLNSNAASPSTTLPVIRLLYNLTCCTAAFETWLDAHDIRVELVSAVKNSTAHGGDDVSLFAQLTLINLFGPSRAVSVLRTVSETTLYRVFELLPQGVASGGEASTLVGWSPHAPLLALRYLCLVPAHRQALWTKYGRGALKVILTMLSRATIGDGQVGAGAADSAACILHEFVTSGTAAANGEAEPLAAMRRNPGKILLSFLTRACTSPALGEEGQRHLKAVRELLVVGSAEDGNNNSNAPSRASTPQGEDGSGVATTPPRFDSKQQQHQQQQPSEAERETKRARVVMTPTASSSSGGGDELQAFASKLAAKCPGASTIIADELRQRGYTRVQHLEALARRPPERLRELFDGKLNGVQLMQLRDALTLAFPSATATSL